MRTAYRDKEERMTMATVEISVPEEMKVYVETQSEKEELIRNALLLWTSIKSSKISHGKAAELLGVNKADLIALYGTLGLPYLDMSSGEIDEDIATYERLERRL